MHERTNETERGGRNDPELHVSQAERTVRDAIEPIACVFLRGGPDERTLAAQTERRRERGIAQLPKFGAARKTGVLQLSPQSCRSIETQSAGPRDTIGNSVALFLRSPFDIPGTFDTYRAAAARSLVLPLRPASKFQRFGLGKKQTLHGPELARYAPPEIFLCQSELICCNIRDRSGPDCVRTDAAGIMAVDSIRR